MLDGLGTPDALGVLLMALAGLAVISLTREMTDGLATWLTWRTRIVVQLA